MVRLEDEQRRGAEVLTPYGKALDGAGSGRKNVKCARLQGRPRSRELYLKRFRSKVYLVGPTRAAPIPRHPAARIKKSLQAEATTCSSPESVDFSGFFSVAGTIFPNRLAQTCIVVFATLLSLRLSMIGAEHSKPD